MTQDQEAAAKWKMFEDYKALTGRLAVILREVKMGSQPLETISMTLHANPGRLATMDIGGYPEKSWLEGKARELRTVEEELESLRGHLRMAGMDTL